MPLHRILTSVFFFLVFRIDTDSRRFADSDDDREEGENIKVVPHYLLVGIIRDPVDGATNRWGSNFVCRANTVKPGDEAKLNCKLHKVEWDNELKMPYSETPTTWGGPSGGPPGALGGNSGGTRGGNSQTFK